MMKVSLGSNRKVGQASQPAFITGSFAPSTLAPVSEIPTLEYYESSDDESSCHDIPYGLQQQSPFYDSDSDEEDEDVNDSCVPLSINKMNKNRFSDLLLQEIKNFARLRRARNIYQKALADNVLVLAEIEKRIPLEEHSVFEMETIKNSLTNLCFDAAGLYDAYQDQIAGEIEKVLFLYGALREQGSWTGVASTIMLYVRTHYTGSVLLAMKQIFGDYFSCLEEHSSFTEWMDVMKMTHTNWKLATTNEGFQHVTKMLSMLIGAGMLQASNIQCEVSGIKLFSDLCVPKFVSAFDLIDAAMSCIVFFVEGGYECIQKGSISPLIFGEKDYATFDETYLQCKKYYDYALPGNYYMLDVDENVVVKKIMDAIEEGKRLAQLTKNSFSKKMILDRVGKLQEMESTLQQHRLAAGVRMKPYCIVAYGSTGVGKTTIAPLLMFHVLASNGFDASDDSCIMLKAGVKHEENYRTYLNGVYYDDFANVKPEFVQESPCEDLLATVNTARCTARMASLELKNKVSKQPKAVVVSTNVKDLNAPAYSEEPASITRRGDVFFTFAVRPAFETNGQLDSKKVEDHYDGKVPFIPDLWIIDVEISVPIKNPTPGRHDTIGWKTVVWNGKELKGIDMKTALQYVVMSSKAHFAFQKVMVERSTGLSNKLELCEKCKSSKDICVCGLVHTVSYMAPAFTGESIKKGNPRAHLGTRKPAPLYTVRPGYCKCPNCMGARKAEDCPYAKKCTCFMCKQEGSRKTVTQCQHESALREKALLDSRPVRTEPLRESELELLKFEENLRRPDALEEHSLVFEVLRYVDLLHDLARFRVEWLVPQCLVRSYAVLSVVKLFIVHPNAKYHVFFGFLIPYFVENRVGMLLALLLYLYFLYTVFMSYVYIVETNLTQQKQAAWHTTKHIAARTAYILGAGVAIKVIYDMAKRYYAMRSLRGPFQEQAFMHPSDEDIKERDANDVTAEIAKEHNWATVQTTPLPASQESKTITEDDLVSLCQRNTACVMDDGKLVTNMFFIKSNVALIPTHLIKKWNDKLCIIVRNDTKTVGGNFKCYLSYQHSAQIPNTDVSLVWVPNGGSWKDLTKYFPTEVLKEDFGVRLCTRSIAGVIQPYKAFARHGNQVLTSCTAYGYSYTIDSFIGMCGAPVVAQKKAPMIVGVHVAGRVAAHRGFAPALAQSDLEYALEVLSERPSVLLSHSNGRLKPVIYDKPMLDEQAVHPKSPLNRLEVDEVTPNMEVYGSCSGRATYYSQVVSSVISPMVTAVCGVPQRWGKPKFGKGDPWHESLKYSSKPSCGIEPSLIDKAVVDYLRPMYKLLTDRPAVKAEIKPLARMEIICGVDGKKFIDKMPPQTAIGHPLSGPKANHLTYLDPEDFPGFNHPAELNQRFWDEFDEAIAMWSKGERYHAVFKACLKDEPTPLDKDKVRVFQAAPMILQLGVRKYFLPIARFMSLFPAISECAVGLNCMGPDWEDFQAHIKKYGEDRILAGDYSKYDLRMPAQITMAAFKVLISIAQFCGYSDEDLTIMRGIATDICYPTIAFNGDLLQFVGSNPSGQNLTVYINSIGNSLLFRCAFFSMIKGQEFRNVCALGTYGDDAKSSVKEGFDEFNHISVAKFFADHDMKFTMPDKTSTPTPYMNDADADFLKRKNVYIPELEQHCGALDEDSIFKSLHANVKSKALTREELASACIDGALREWFFHGREVYEMRQAQMIEVAEKSGIDHACPMLYTPFDHQVNRWRHRYLGEPLIDGHCVDDGHYGLLYYDPDEYPLEEHSMPDCGSEMLPIAEDMYATCNGSTYEEMSLSRIVFNLVSIPLQFYIIYLIGIGRLKFNFSAWNWTHTIMFGVQVVFFGPVNFYFNFIHHNLVAIATGYFVVWMYHNA